ncbi:MAG: acyltransferase family protein [Prevotella sp.]|nr:acyltransferase family protein [Prevotella sp.]
MIQTLPAGKILSREHTRCLQGLSIIVIMVLHFVMQTDGYPRFLNLPASVGVAIFMFVSGFGLNESYKAKGLNGFIIKKFKRIVIPFWIFLLLTIPFKEAFTPEWLFNNIFFIKCDLWFVTFLLRWYAAFWIACRFCGRYKTAALFLFGFINLFMSQLESEQAFSFFFGYMTSVKIDSIRHWDARRILTVALSSLALGMAFVLLKEIPYVHSFKGTQIYNIILLFIKMPLGIFVIALPYFFPGVIKSKILGITGLATYELFMVHTPFMAHIDNNTALIPLYTAFSCIMAYYLYRFDKFIAKPGNGPLAAATAIYSGVGYMTICKYTMRATDSFGYVIVTYLCVVLTLVYILMRCNNRDFMRSPKTFYAAVTVMITAMIAVQYHFDPMQIQVDRWSAIHNVIAYLMQGRFPYAAETHLGGFASPFPVWMIFHIPFYFLNNVGLSIIVAAVIFIYVMKRFYGTTAATATAILMTASINLWYEVSVRSDMITNFLLLAAFIIYINKRNIDFTTRTFIISVCCGLWLGTRLSTAFPLFVCLLPGYLRAGAKKMITAPLTIIITFISVFLPLAVWNFDALTGAEYNPFVLQTRQGTPVDSLIMLAVATYFALKWRGNDIRLYTFTAVTMTLLPATAFVHSMYKYDTWTEIFNSMYDITYFNMALPFAIAAIAAAVSSEKASSR